MGKRFEAQKRQLRVIDTTVKTSDRLFSPTWSMVLAHKAKFKAFKEGELSEAEMKQADEEYTVQYRRMMIESWVMRKEEWKAILRSDEPIAIACYCPAGQFCHRLLLKDMFEELCGKLEIPFTYYGEMT